MKLERKLREPSPQSFLLHGSSWPKLPSPYLQNKLPSYLQLYRPDVRPSELLTARHRLVQSAINKPGSIAGSNEVGSNISMNANTRLALSARRLGRGNSNVLFADLA